MCSATSILALVAEMRLEIMETRSLSHFPPYCPWGELRGAWKAGWEQSRLYILSKSTNRKLGLDQQDGVAVTSPVSRYTMPLTCGVKCLHSPEDSGRLLNFHVSVSYLSGYLVLSTSTFPAVWCATISGEATQRWAVLHHRVSWGTAIMLVGGKARTQPGVCSLGCFFLIRVWRSLL